MADHDEHPIEQKEFYMLIGLDIGGTKIEICVLDKQGSMLYRQRIATPDNYSQFVDCVCSLIVDAEQATQPVDSIGIGLPGAVSPVTGLIKNANCTFLNGQDLSSDLQYRLGREVKLANDANCFALSEAIDGAGKESMVVFGAILGTGCGGSIVVNRQVLVGPNAICGEWGHNPLPGYHLEQDGAARYCYCGRQNCIERFISGSGFQDSYQALTGECITASEIMKRYKQQEPEAIHCYTQLIDHMARSFAGLVNVLDPDIIVLGGGLSNIDELYRDLPTATARHVFSDSAQVHFAKAVFGDSSGIRGAAWL
ncbi:ROK family Glucokinase with ambiguous substrate specificity [Vibrio cholerae 12129(1)]|nr:ROK family Glucokinase with ambiguous substrate specificity [Vibrio cholerae MJ-1236]EEO00724.1 ROK family Glucokinase with ambiguous substrate specificity [Vibrio cholerae 12129(1)]EEO11646.1 ROK family Glucokinase with ambiguous substrate specificity [Vibrio cholerae RC9]EEO18556.1 ROK family Glucokinase with ambiguous substrate specificity [Vibrio cholerae B33]EEO20957.1 ROK family Glucokinase with ambiguous substrate specificity [Vibrio cholerae BX 330286]KKP09390.1 fructokinase [Vibrio